MTDILADFERRSDEIDAKREARLRQGLLRAPAAAPEQAARANALSDRTGQPFGVVAENLDQYEQEDALRRIEDIGKRNPVVGDFMADPRRAAIARDDVGNLNKLSQAIRNTWQAGRDFGLSSVYPTWRSHMLNWESIGGGESGFRATPAPTYVEELATGFAAGWERGIGHSALAGGIDLRSDRTKRSEEIVARGLGYQSADDMRAGRRAAFAAEQERRAQAVERVSEETESQFDLIAKANEADSLWEALGLIARAPRAVGLVTSQSVGMGAPGLAATAATGGMGRPATMAAAGGSSGWVEYGASISETLAESGVDMMDGHAVAQALRNPKLMAEAKERAAKRGLAIGAFDAVTAGLAGKLLINARRGVASAAWRTGAETGIQIAGGSAGEAAAQFVTGEEMQWGDIIVEGLAELPFSAVEARANYRSARERGQVRWINEQLDIVRRSSAGSAALSEATIAAGNAMLAKRSPEDARAFAEAAGGDGNVYLDAEAARTLFQSDWQVLVDAVGGDTTLTQQLAAGDVVIPAAEYFARVAQLPNAEEISRHARLQADALSQVELDAYDFDALAAEMAGDADAAARAEPGGEPSARQRVQDDVYGQLLSTDRYSTAAAEQQAKLFAAGITRLAEMWGTDPWTLYERRMAGIRSAPGPGQADPRSTPPWAGTGRLDALLDALRSPESSDERRIFGPTITDFIVGRGGVTDVGGDLRSMDAHRQRIGLINRRGEDLDRAREAAAEAGYLPADSTVADLLDLIDADLRGNPVYSPAQADRAAQDFQRDLDDLQEAITQNERLRDMPADEFNALTNQQIAEILFGRSFEQTRPGSFNNPLPITEMESAPVGAWVAGPNLPGIDTRRQIQDVPLDRIDATEFDSAGELAPEKRADAARYAEAMRAGEQFPNGRGSELPNGMVKLQDGHRRYAAARAVGAETMRLAVSPLSLGQAANFDQDAATDFDPSAYRPEVVSWAQETYGDTIAPNGNPAWQNFVAWFGDSKAVDAEGQPLALWHGTREQFDSFDIGRVGQATGNDGFFGTGFYFTDSRDIAGAYGGGWSRDAERAAGANVMQVYLAVRNPLELTEAEPSYKRSLNKSRRALQKLEGWTDEELSMLADPEMEFISDFTSAIGGQRFREVVEQNGFDSVHVTGAFGSMNADEWVVFQPNQAKSAADNRGNFSPADPSILGQGPVAEATGTPEFRRWFGDSKVVDENGEPLVVYHGGTVEDVFDTERGASGDTQLGRGAYFGPIGVAQEWVDFRGEGQVGEYYLSLQAPFDETSSWTPPQEMLDALESRLVEMGVPPEDAREVHRPTWGTLTHLASVLAGVEGGITTWQAADRINSALREVGFDGIIADWQSGSRQYVAFRPEQIKSATNNAGTFSPTSPNVFEQSAFHGTPHDVDRFSLQRIGTGEGNQAFGWGLYFASKREVADFYRRNTAGIARNIPATIADDALRAAGGDRGQAVRSLVRRRDALPEAARGNTQAAIDWLRRGQDHGRLYQVDIPEDSDLLDYDAPLSEQPEKVRAALEPEIADLRGRALDQESGWGEMAAPDRAEENITGQFIYRVLADDLGPQGASQRLLELGIPGLRYLVDSDSRDAGDGTHNYVIWDEAAISEPVRLFQDAAENAEAPVFYSAMLRAVEQGRGAPRRAEAGAWKGWLDGAQRRGEMRKGERDWIGIDAWLDEQDGPVTREAVADFIRANQVQIEEVVLSGELDDATARERLRAFEDRMLEKYGDGWASEMSSDEEHEWGLIGMPVGKPEAKFGDYTVPGGQNYRELLLTLPDSGPDPVASMSREDLGAIYEDEIGYNPAEDDPSITTEELRQMVRDLAPGAAQAQETLINRQISTAYHSPHFDQPNILAHVRFNERTDADGNLVLFIEEIQSDWHQAGRDRGYGAEQAAAVLEQAQAAFNEAEAAYNARVEELSATGEFGRMSLSETAAMPEAVAVSEARDQLRQAEVSSRQVVPDAPFKGTDEWAMLAFKRMVRWAVDNGFDRIAWTPGDVQAARYDLSNQVSSIESFSWGDGTRAVNIDLGARAGSVTLTVDAEGIVTATEGMAAGSVAAVGNRLDELIGKEMADKVMAVEYRERFAGDDLKVGGAGMRAFYDNILPKAVNKWAKRMGGRVGTARVLPSAMKPGASRRSPITVHALDVTDAMRDAVSQGMTLFQSQLGDRLVAVHNLSAENLLFSDRLGGLPAPSIGITKAASPFRGFGSISLIGRRSLAEPGADNPVFSADAYTQRFPEMIWPRVKSAKAEKFLDGMDDIDQVWDYLVNNPDRDRAIEVAVQSSGFMRRWLESQGEKPVENVTRENRPPSPWMDDQQLLDVIYQLQDRGVYIYDLPASSPEAIEIAEAARGAIDRYIERAHEDEAVRARLRETYTGESTFDPEGGLAYSVQSRLAAHAASLKRPPEVDRYATQQALDEQIGERRPEFERWVAEQVTEQFDEPKIQLGRRKVPVTLENVVEAMTRQRRVAGSESTMTFSSGQVAARNAKRYRTIEEIQSDRDRIVSPDAERKAGESLEKQLEDYRTAAIQYFTGKNYRGEIDTWEALDSSMKSLADAAKKPATAANVAAALRRNGFEGFPDAVAEAGAEALLGIRQAVTDYFEAKPQRAVSLSEFAGAVIPADASQEVRDTLDKHGIRWMEYGEELGLTQEQAVSQLSAELDGGTGDILFQPDGAEPAQPQAPRGQIEIFPDRRMAISLFEGADRSTFLHETGHFFLEVLRDIAADPNAPDQARQEMAILLDWFGIESADQIGREHHEQFARGFEKYLAEGRAPSPELQSAFSAFKAWLLSIYRNLLNLNVTLTDEVRGVMDRMLASDVEIETAQIRQGMEPLFTGAPEGEAGQIGLTEKQLADYADMLAAANEEARAEVMQKLMASHDREAKRWYREETARVRAEVEAEYAAQPVYRAARVLAGARTMHDGTPIPDDIAGMKLDKAALVALYGEPYLKRIRGMYRISGGVHPDDAASVLGFPSGDDLVTALANRGDMQARVEAETTARMRERHGDPMTDGTLPELAMDAVHNNARVKVLQRELDMLADLTEQPRMTLRAMSELARRTMDGKTPRNIRPHDHLVAERKAARQATAAAARGDYAAALLAKRQQAFNAALYREARKATDEFDRHLRYLRRVEGRRGAIGKAGHDYLEQVDALLEGLELRPASGRAVERRQRLAEWVARQEADGRPVNVPQNLLDETGLVNIRDMPLGDLRGVVETIKQIEHLAKTKNALFLAGQERDREAVDAEMAASVAAGHENVPERTGDPTRRDIAARAMRDMDIMRLLPANIARELDGYAEGGAVFTNVIQPIRDAIYGKVVPEQTAMMEAVAAIYQKHYTSAEIANLDKPVYRPVVSDTWSKGRILSLAMNWGSDGNREAILTQARSRLTEQQVGELLGTLDARDWQFVQDMVDQVNSYWPAIAEAQRRRTGLVPEKVAAAPFTITTSDGETITVRGGYFPLKYDAERSGYGASQQEIDDFYNAIRTGKTARAATRNGHTIERVGSGGKTVDLGLDIATSHMRDVIRDVHLGDAVAYVHAVLNGQDFKAAVTDAGMAAHLDALNLWLKDVAAGEMAPRSGLEQAIRFIRRNVTASVLGFKATVALLQVTGLIQTASVIGRRNTIRGIARLFGQSWVGPNSIWKRIRADSAYMDERLGKIPDAVRQVANARDGKFKTGHAALIRWGYAPLARMQAIADAATWLAGEALGAKMFDGDMVKARAYADDLVIRAQAPENFIDKPAIARGTLGENHRQSELVKATTMLLSYMIAKGNVAREKYQDTRFSRPTQAVKFGVDMIQLFALEGMLVAVLTNGLPDDDDDDGYYLDDWVRWITAETFQGAVAGLPLISPLGTASRGYTPQGVIERTWGNIWRSLRILTDDEFNERDAKALVDMAGVATGIPSSQINSTADALWRVRDGEDVAPIEYLVRPEKPRD